MRYEDNATRNLENEEEEAAAAAAAAAQLDGFPRNMPIWQGKKSGHTVLKNYTGGPITEQKNTQISAREEYSGAGEAVQLDKATAAAGRIGKSLAGLGDDGSIPTQMNRVCWLCGQHIFTKSELNTQSCIYGYPEVEHVLPLKYAHKLLSVPGEKVNKQPINYEQDKGIFDQQIALEIRDSHKLCNALKGQRNFIEFHNGPNIKGMWRIKTELLKEYYEILGSLMLKLNGGSEEGAIPDRTAATRLLQRICQYLNSMENNNPARYIEDRWLKKLATASKPNQDYIERVNRKYGLNNDNNTKENGQETQQESQQMGVFEKDLDYELRNPPTEGAGGTGGLATVAESQDCPTKVAKTNTHASPRTVSTTTRAMQLNDENPDIYVSYAPQSPGDVMGTPAAQGGTATGRAGVAGNPKALFQSQNVSAEPVLAADATHKNAGRPIGLGDGPPPGPNEGV